jgi:hypothetical protein
MDNILSPKQVSRSLESLTTKNVSGWIRYVQGVQLVRAGDQIDIRFHVVRRPKGFLVCPKCGVYEDFHNAHMIFSGEAEEVVVCHSCSINKCRSKFIETVGVFNEKPPWFVVDSLKLGALLKNYMIRLGIFDVSPPLRKIIDEFQL